MMLLLLANIESVSLELGMSVNSYTDVGEAHCNWSWWPSGLYSSEIRVFNFFFQ